MNSDQPLDMSRKYSSLDSIDITRALRIQGHEAEVYSIAWHPAYNLFASGSGDNTGRLWNLDNNSSMVLKHIVQGGVVPCDKKVSSVDWSADGNLLVSGAADGFARVWRADGGLHAMMGPHRGFVFTALWNRRGTHILTCGEDKVAVVWDGSTGHCTQKFEFAGALLTDVGWQSNTAFALSTQNNLIHVCELGWDRPIKTFIGHTDEVNVIKWDQNGQLLASASSDKTVKVWSMSHDHCLYSFQGHTKGIFMLDWSTSTTILASASLDNTVKMWELSRGICLYNMTQHYDLIYTIEFSPDGKFLATGAIDKWIHIWSASTGYLVNSYAMTCSVFTLTWNSRGDKIAVGLADGSIVVLDLRRGPSQ